MDDVSRAIGSLESSVKTIGEDQKAVQLSVKTVENDVTTIKQDLVHIKKVLDEIAPAARKINNWEQRMLGMGTIVALGGGVATLLLTKVKELVFG